MYERALSQDGQTYTPDSNGEAWAELWARYLAHQFRMGEKPEALALLQLRRNNQLAISEKAANALAADSAHTMDSSRPGPISKPDLASMDATTKVVALATASAAGTAGNSGEQDPALKLFTWDLIERYSFMVSLSFVLV